MPYKTQLTKDIACGTGGTDAARMTAGKEEGWRGYINDQIRDERDTCACT